MKGVRMKIVPKIYYERNVCENTHRIPMSRSLKAKKYKNAWKHMFSSDSFLEVVRAYATVWWLCIYSIRRSEEN